LGGVKSRGEGWGNKGGKKELGEIGRKEKRKKGTNSRIKGRAGRRKGENGGKRKK